MVAGLPLTGRSTVRAMVAWQVTFLATIGAIGILGHILGGGRLRWLASRVPTCGHGISGAQLMGLACTKRCATGAKSLGPMLIAGQLRSLRRPGDGVGTAEAICTSRA